ncbi:Arsenite efflux pump ArsB, ACR3 family [Prauserella marina]|uniref:Arsenite efflux pump ArsB, ACR3 family n=1 Tax=Prauserella marina TaxID=530584 RepID=A0A1G6K1G0_9PSEU|nr:bile acid:sodium symporter [Prauserella marina]PWV84351.1 ACR3 family arsenite efflux pump ArsB [Prauserella marina]SDC24711.1 Arsenite efflux pump ArsB, ACR3 family [Prauserella marina]
MRGERMRAIVAWLERRQVPLYLGGLALGAVAGLLAPGIARPAGTAIHPVLALLLYATFLGIPFGRIGQAFRNWRFLVTILAVNFAAVPVVVFVLSRIVAHDHVLLVGVLFVLLTPCIDYVIVFCGLAGGAEERLLASAPLLMLAQMLLLPLYLWLFVGAEFVRSIELAPFVEAFVLIIAIPLVAAGLTQFAAARARWGARVREAMTGAMVPLMVLTLAVVVASQIAGVGARFGSLLLTVPVYVVFAAVMVPVGALAGRLAGLDVPGRRAIVFSGATRNSLVVLPLVLALPASFDLAPLVVVTQTLVELVVMVIFVRLVPRVIAEREQRTTVR